MADVIWMGAVVVMTVARELSAAHQARAGQPSSLHLERCSPHRGGFICHRALQRRESRPFSLCDTRGPRNMSDCAAGHAKPRYLPRLTIDSLTYHHPKSSLSSMTSSSYSTRASIASSLSSSSSSSDGFFVYCVHDFEAADADQLSFRSTEILEVVRQEDSVSTRCHCI